MINLCKTCKYEYTKKNEKPCIDCKDGNNWEKETRPEMMPEIVQHYEAGSRIPDWIRVSFADGSTAVYDMRAEMPAPIIRENIRIIRSWKTGYQYQQPKRRRNRK